jgi:Xaa-Pro aminopeptidase
MSRLGRLAAGLEQPLLVTDGVNVRYLTGFQSSNCALVVRPDGATTLYTDFRYLQAARAVEGVDVVQTQRDVAGGLAGLLGGVTVGFEAGKISYAQWDTIPAGGADLVPTRGLVEGLRAVKDAAELDAIRRACAISDEVYALLAHERLVGRTESEVAWWIERTFRERGAEALSFGSIVASGENGARPHAGASSAVIPEGTLVTVDMGCVEIGRASCRERVFGLV